MATGTEAVRKGGRGGQTYEQIQQQIQRLNEKAEAIREKEALGVIEKIKAAIEHYGLTPADLFGKRTKAKSKKVTKKAKKAPRAAKYSDGAGNTWSGMGRRPDWVRAALEQGKTLDDLKA